MLICGYYYPHFAHYKRDPEQANAFAQGHQLEVAEVDVE